MHTTGIALLIFISLSLAAPGCGNKEVQQQGNPCEGVECSGKGRCVVVPGGAACNCNDGFQAIALSCIAIESDAEGTEDVAEQGDESAGDLIEETGDRTEDIPDYDIVEEEEITPCGNMRVDSGEECDDGRDGDPDDGCRDDCTYSCHDAGECDDGLGCTSDTCDTVTAHTCGHARMASGAVCRPAAGVCDVEEKCGGTADACPADAFVTSGETCSDGDYCTVSDACDGDGRCAGAPRAGLFGVAAVSAGYAHTCVLLSTGGVKCWGQNSSGQLGDGTTVDKVSPQDVAGLSSGVAAVSSGGQHTCALLSTGGVKCWGNNEYGKLGDGTITGRSTPGDVTGLGAPATDICVGGGHSCAIVEGGAAKCWGWNSHGQVGDGTTSSRPSPVDVAGLPSGVAALSAGGGHTCALTSGGGVKCWGWNTYGQVGDGTSSSRPSPVDVAGLSTGAAAVAAGNMHTCALLSGGGVKCWGLNNKGQLGDNTVVNRGTPVAVHGLSSGVYGIGAGAENTTCALLGSGAPACWGQNDYGQLGDGTTVERHTPVAAAGLAGRSTAVSPGGFHSCALLTGGGVACWGLNGDGQLGDGTTADRHTPASVVCH